MKVQVTDQQGNVIKETPVKDKEVAPGVKQIDVFSLFTALRPENIKK